MVAEGFPKYEWKMEGEQRMKGATRMYIQELHKEYEREAEVVLGPTTFREVSLGLTASKHTKAQQRSKRRVAERTTLRKATAAVLCQTKSRQHVTVSFSQHHLQRIAKRVNETPPFSLLFPSLPRQFDFWRLLRMYVGAGAWLRCRARGNWALVQRPPRKTP